MPTFAEILADRLRRDPGQPLVTFYDHATGERVELSATTYGNWVAKAASLLVDELGLERGDTLRVDLPPHWLGTVFLGAAWTAGLVVTDRDDPAAVVCGPGTLEAWAGRAADLTVLACSLLPLGVRFAEPVPAGVHDVGVEIWSQPDAFVPWDPPGPEDAAVEWGLDTPSPSGSGYSTNLGDASPSGSGPSTNLGDDSPSGSGHSTNLADASPSGSGHPTNLGDASPSGSGHPTDLTSASLTQRELWETAAAGALLDDGGRLLTVANPASPPGLATFTEPLVRGGSVVLVAHAERERLEATYAAEHATARFPA